MKIEIKTSKKNISLKILWVVVFFVLWMVTLIPGSRGFSELFGVREEIPLSTEVKDIVEIVHDVATDEKGMTFSVIILTMADGSIETRLTREGSINLWHIGKNEIKSDADGKVYFINGKQMKSFPRKGVLYLPIYFISCIFCYLTMYRLWLVLKDTSIVDPMIGYWQKRQKAKEDKLRAQLGITDTKTD